MSAGAALAHTRDAGPGRAERWLCAAILAWFAARLVTLTLQLHPYVPPDEVTHVGRAIAYSAVLGVPADGPMTWEHGLVSHRPWLYYWLLGRVAALSDGLVVLRLVNAGLALATAWVGILWVREWCGSPLVRVTFAVVLTNVPMFTGIGAAVSYDNGANLAAAASLLFFTRFRARRRVEDFLLFVLLLGVGCLVKRTLLPFGLLLGLLFLWRERAELASLPRELWASLGRPHRAVLAVAVLAVAGASLVLYGGNLLAFGRLVPGFEQVVGEEAAMTNRVFARSHIVDGFREGRLDIRAARALAEAIPHKGDRSDTLFLLKAAQLPDSALLAPLPYAVEWSRIMLESATGYAGHRRAEKGPAALAVTFGLLLLALALALRRYRPGEAGGAVADATWLSVGYALVLLWLVHHPTYRESRSLELAVQGRYLFPVLVPLCGLLVHSLLAHAPARLQPWVAAGLAGFALWGDLPWLLRQTDARWFLPDGP